MAETAKQNIQNVVDTMTQRLSDPQKNVESGTAAYWKAIADADKARQSGDMEAFNAAIVERDKAREATAVAGSNLERQRDIVQGSQFAADILGDEGLGRATTGLNLDRAQTDYNLGRINLDTTLGRSTASTDLARLRDSDIKAIESRFQDASLGMNSAEALARRESALDQINRGTQSASRNLQSQLARFGVKGGAAATQLAGVQMQGLEQKSKFERDLDIQQREAQRQGLLDLANFATQTRQFDIGQSNTEAQLRLDQERFNLGQESTQKQLDFSLQQANLGQSNLEAQYRQAAEQTNLQQQLTEQQAAMGLEQFNLSQAAKEKGLVAGLGVQFAGLGAGERGADKATAASLAASNTSSGGGTVICTELYNQKRMKIEYKFTGLRYAAKHGKKIHNGYLRWATPLVNIMRKSEKFSNFMEWLFLPAIKYMNGEYSLHGKIVYNIGLGLSKLLSK